MDAVIASQSNSDQEAVASVPAKAETVVNENGLEEIQVPEFLPPTREDAVESSVVSEPMWCLLRDLWVFHMESRGTTKRLEYA